MASQLSLLSQIAAEISENAKKLDEYLTLNNLPQPTFAVDAPDDYETIFKDADAKTAQNALANLGRKLYLLMVGGPYAGVRTQTMTEMHIITALGTLCHFNVAENVPFDEGIGFEELSSKTGLNQDILTRSVRLVETNYFFEEKKPGIVSHTARSKVLATLPAAKGVIQLSVTEAFPAASKMNEALEKSPEGNIAPFDLLYGEPFFLHMTKNAEKNALFSKFMGGNQNESRVQELVNAVDWERFTGTIVDVGGNVGHIDVSLAQKYPDLKYVVEDRPDVKTQAESFIASSDQSSRITFVGHDFFEPQPEQAKGASAYILSLILHDWPDDKCQVILKHVVDAMSKDSSIIISDSILPEPGQLLEHQEMVVRASDWGMFGFLKARERTLGDMERLVKSVDDRLELVKFVGPPNTVTNSILEFRFRDE